MITKSGVKLLDFGLAKTLEAVARRDRKGASFDCCAGRWWHDDVTLKRLVPTAR